MKRLQTSVMAILLLGAGASLAEPDEALLGQGQGYPVGSIQTWARNPYRVGSWSALDQVPGVRVNRVAPSSQVRPLPPMAQPPALRYRYRNLGYSIDEYLDRQRATGLLILKDGQVVAERYRYARPPTARFVSFSMAKSVVSLLVGVAHAQGLIASLDDPAEKYAKDLAGTPYGATSLRHLLNMSSGLTFTERYDGNDDVMRMGRAFVADPQGSMAVLKTIQQRHAPEGERFVYASAETEVLGYALRGATGRSLAGLTQSWLWEPMGAEHEAFWRTGADGQEGAFGFFNASLRDWGRLGALLAEDGQVAGRQVVPRDYLLAGTDAAQLPAALKPGRATPYFGYGHQFWVLPMKERTFVMQGVHGQRLYVQPASRTVMVITSVWEHPAGAATEGPSRETDALWRGVLTSLGARTD
ncbi:serine hydrolase [Hydrogenophaga sp. 2FB]|uniref:serine hydrolase domain-containing protein n=1 Tax=Hydrogenophaga sp. 2FB TaxID=2502187 RepID=UPI0010F6CDFD|nr:serine hydrolase [Hydrogenophaga sp. 2FB]